LASYLRLPLKASQCMGLGVSNLFYNAPILTWLKMPLFAVWRLLVFDLLCFGRSAPACKGFCALQCRQRSVRQTCALGQEWVIQGT
jgi:hypothetical protein